MLIAVRAEVEDVDAWRDGFKTHGDLFKSQGVSVAYMGATEGNSVIGVFEANDVDEFMRIFNDPATAEAMANDKITGGVELFVLDETFTPQKRKPMQDFKPQDGNSLIYTVSSKLDKTEIYIGKTDRSLLERKEEHETSALKRDGVKFHDALVQTGFSNL